jgi:hypothetical protein
MAEAFHKQVEPAPQVPEQQSVPRWHGCSGERQAPHVSSERHRCPPPQLHAALAQST